MRLQELLTSVLGHDLRTPLGSILMSAQLLVRTGNDTGITAARRILHSGRRMTRMIDQLVDFARARSNLGLPLRFVSMDLGDTCRGLIDELRKLHLGRVVVIDLTGDLAGAWDPERLHQVLFTVIGNALQHGDPGHPVCVQLNGNFANQILLTIENHGEIPRAVHDHLFDPFRSVQAVRKKAQGLGLGLYISEAIVKGHGGSLVVQSSDGRTLVTVRLPRTCGTKPPHA